LVKKKKKLFRLDVKVPEWCRASKKLQPAQFGSVKRAEWTR